jgi:hypothetical protein
VFVPRGAIHRFACTGEAAGRILAIFSPGGMDGFFRLAGQPARREDPPPPIDQDEIIRTQAAGKRFGVEVVTWDPA